jgi:PilZ domain
MSMAEQSKLATTQFNRRRDPRINLNLPVEYTMMVDVAPTLPTRSGTIGCGGLMLYLPMPVSVGATMKLKVHLPDRVTVSCTARVVWTELLTGLEVNDFKTGVAFDQISEDDLGILRTFIKEQQNPIQMPAGFDNGALG